MTAPWRKALRDFWQERTRTALVVLAIALGILGFSTVLSTYAILTRELDLGYLATNPASATLRVHGVDDALVAAVLSGHGVSAAEPRRVVMGRIKVGPMEWKTLTIFVLTDYANIRVSKLVPDTGAWPPAAGEILLERDAFQVARVHVGDPVTIKTARGSEQRLRVTGSVHDVGQAQARMENIVYAYITGPTLAVLGEEPYLDQLKILVAENRLDEKHIRTVAEDVRQLIEGRGHQVSRVDVPRPGKHPHADLTGLLLLAMSSFGVFVLLLSGILVVNLLNALMAAQVRQIGVMKAIGGSSGQIRRIYFGQALLLGIAAILIALPASRAASRIFCRYLAGFLNFDITSFAVPAWVDLLAAAVGLVVPLLAAAYPVRKGCGIAVREALADFGVSRNTFGTSVFDRALAGLSGVARPVLFAMRNSFRQRTRLALTVLTLASGGVFFMVALNVRSSLIHTLDNLFRAKKYELAVSLGGLVVTEKIERAVRQTPGIVRWEGGITTEGALPTVADALVDGNRSVREIHVEVGEGGPHGPTDGNRFSVIALPAESKVLQLQIVEGRGLQEKDTDAIVVNGSLAAKLPQLKVGQSVIFRLGAEPTTWRVVGIAREPFSPPVAYVPLRFFQEHGNSEMVNTVRLVLAQTDPDATRRVKSALEQNLERENLRGITATSQVERRFSFDQHMLMIYVFLIVMSGILACVGGLGLMTTMSLNVMERRREMGVLRAIGATPGTVWLLIVAEGGTIGVLSFLLAALAAWPIGRGLGTFLVVALFQGGLDFSFELRGLFAWFAVSVLLSLLSSFLPAWQASKCTVREAISYE